MKADETLDAKQNIAQLSGSDLEDLGIVSIPMVFAQTEVVFTADLTGGQEIPPVITNAAGSIDFTLDQEAGEMSYYIDVGGLEGILQAHIHQGRENENGDIVVWLFNATESTDEIQGEPVSGFFTAEDFVGPLQGKNMSDLVDAIESRQAYVNIHTEANPLGELRGTIVEEGIPEPSPEAAPIDEDEFFAQDPITND